MTPDQFKTASPIYHQLEDAKQMVKVWELRKSNGVEIRVLDKTGRGLVLHDKDNESTIKIMEPNKFAWDQFCDHHIRLYKSEIRSLNKKLSNI